MLATLLRPDGGTRPRSSATTSSREPQIVRQLIGVTGQYASVDETLSATENLVIFCRAARALPRRGQAQGRRTARGVRAHRGGEATAARTSPAACVAGSTWRPSPDRPAAAASSSTSRRPGWTRAPAARCGTRSATSSRRLDGPADHPVPRRGRPARRPDRRDRPRPGRRRGHRRRAEGVGRRLLAAAAARRPGRHRRRPARSSSTCSACAAHVSPEAAPDHRPDGATPTASPTCSSPCASAGIHLTELSVQKPTLDEVFLTITGHGVGRRRRRPTPTPSSKEPRMTTITIATASRRSDARRTTSASRQTAAQHADDGLPRPAQDPPHARAAGRRRRSSRSSSR